MKIAKEYSLLFIIGLFVLAYLLDLVVTPLNIPIKSPYQFFQSEYIFQFPFSTLSVAIKSIALFLAPLWFFSFFKDNGFAKPIILLVWAGLIQLYAVQDIVNKTRLISMEWSLSLAASGALLFLPTLYFFLKAIVFSMHSNLTNAKMEEAIKQAQTKAKENSEE
jgi:hypothetical protein